jgi:hypothetical protein
MNVKLLTFHAALNYGAVLQTHALSRTLEGMGHNVQIVDLRPEWMWPSKTSFYPGDWLLRRRFIKFLDQQLPSRTKIYRLPGELQANCPDADAYVVGSDQVWNPAITEVLQQEYFLGFVPDSIRKISYAASFGFDSVDWSDDTKQRVGNLLRRFDAVSVREMSGVSICQDIASVSAVPVLDPTFLVENYDHLYVKSPVREPALVAFKFKQDESFPSHLSYLAKKLMLPDYTISSRLRSQSRRCLRLPRPEQWLASIRDASYVFTDSFHGVAFAIIFRKNFIVCPANKARFFRIAELLSELKLQERIFESYDEFRSDDRWLKPVDYTAAAKILSRRIGESKTFLSSALSAPVRSIISECHSSPV